MLIFLRGVLVCVDRDTQSPTSIFANGPHIGADSTSACRDEAVPEGAEGPRTNCADWEVILGSLYVLAHQVRPAVGLLHI